MKRKEEDGGYSSSDESFDYARVSYTYVDDYLITDHTVWTDAAEEELVNVLAELVMNANYIIQGRLTCAAWSMVIRHLTAATQITYPLNQVLTRFYILRRKYEVIKTLLHKDGVGFDIESGRFETTSGIWADLKREYSSMKMFINSIQRDGYRQYEKLKSIAEKSPAQFKSKPSGKKFREFSLTNCIRVLEKMDLDKATSARGLKRCSEDLEWRKAFLLCPPKWRRNFLTLD